MSYECSRCTRTFYSQAAADQHMYAKNHFEFACHVCGETWPLLDDCQEHERISHDRFFCNDCNREFKSFNGLKMHSQAHTHLGKNMLCPFCKGRFATATGMTHHIERGACPNAPTVNRDNLYRFVRAKDPGGVISKNLLEWQGSEHYEATAKAWNGNAYSCYLCNREFTTLHGVNQHLSSPAHHQALYHCPQGGCRKDFKLLGSLINHLESESCGFIRFSQVQSGIQGLISGDRLLM